MTVLLPDGETVPLHHIQSEILGDVAFAAALLPANKKITAVTQAGGEASIQLGDAVYSLSDGQLEQGIVKKTGDRFETTIAAESAMVGSPLYTIDGQVIGFKTASLKDTQAFYPLSALKSITPVLSR